MNRRVVIALLIICQINCELFAFLWFKNTESSLQKCGFESLLQQQQNYLRDFKELFPWFKSDMLMTTMIRQYLSDCFPADERANDPTATADLSELSFPDHYDTLSMPLGLFRINQAILNYSIPIKDKISLMPDYINLHKEMLANEQQRAGYTIHRRLYFRNLVHLGKE
ncbi:unnamed protein product [Litomosoides sigmodontis]|uniref:Uncharacterized protein n=1 Tax=Litomosoides sigmodontis TaxID=42156 RepID=A0A3P7M4P0_LITSI|nr:unnamed protein product [Litomosoides sigmodontis]